MLAHDLPDDACTTTDEPSLFDNLDDTDLDDTDLPDASQRPVRAKDHPALPSAPSTAAAVDPTRQCETGQGQPVPWRAMLQQVLTLQIRRVVFGAPSVIIDAGETRIE